MQSDEAHPGRDQPSSHRRNVSSATATSSRLAKDASHHRLSHAGSSQSMASTARGTIRSKKQRHRVVTTPAWVLQDDAVRLGDRYEDAGPGASALPRSAPSDASSPISGGQQPSSSHTDTSGRSAQQASPSPAGIEHSGQDKGDEPSGSSQPQPHSSPTQPPAQAQSDAPQRPQLQPQDSSKTDDESLGRFWTFTLPTKYRNRLHEHHFKTLRERRGESQRQPHEGDEACTSGSESSSSSSNQADTDEEEDVGRGRGGRSGFLHGLGGGGGGGGGGGSGNKSAGADASHGKRRKERSRNREGPDQHRADAVGMGEPSSAGTAAGFLSAADGMSNWRKRQQQQQQRRASSPGGGNNQQQPPAKPTGDTSAGEAVAAEPSQSATSGDDSSGAKQAEEATVESFAATPPPATEIRARIPHGDGHDDTHNAMTRHQAQTPGWESPWRPDGAMWGDEDVSDDGVGTRSRGTGFFPRSDTKTSKTPSRQRRRRGRRGTKRGPRYDEKTGRMVSGDANASWSSQFSAFLLHNVFAPLLLRIVNICFTTSTLAIAVRLWRVLHKQGAADAVGASPAMGIVIAPLSLVHVGAQVWLEYWGRPIGLWSVGSKLGYQLIELVFIVLWSAELALTFDNYATSSLGCVSWYSDFPDVTSATGETCPGFGAEVLRDPSLQPVICRYQGVLIGLTFTTLVAYVLVFAVSLFRTVSRK
ncbi:unnamed protein product [Parajaminaea phylloscopi]